MSRLFLQLLQQHRLPLPVAEHRFHPVRRWRFDFAWPDSRVALEVEGGAYSAGRHVRAEGFLADCEKYSEAAALGWRIIRVPPADLCATRTLAWIRRALDLAEAA